MAAKRLNWVDVAKGLSIFLVVMYHSTLGVGDALGEVGFMHYVIAFATPFRMPEFFVISGLFLSAVIARPWKQFADRRIVHYLYFYALWAVIQITVKVGLGSGDPATAALQMVEAIVQPYGVLWFIYMLAIFGLVTKLLWQFRIPHAAVLFVAAILQILPINSPAYAITMFAEYYVFFYVGYALAPQIFKFIDFVNDNKSIGFMMLVIWAGVNAALVFSTGFSLTADHVELGYAGWPVVRLTLALTGALAVCSLAGLISQVSPGKLIGWIGERSIVIYLAFVIPMAMTRTILVKLGLTPDAGTLSLIVILSAIAAPLVLHAIIQRFGFGKFLFQRPRWAHLKGTHPGSTIPKRVDRSATSVPAE